MPDTTPIFQLLDPDRTSIPTFYIYDSYDTLYDAGAERGVRKGR